MNVSLVAGPFLRCCDVRMCPASGLEPRSTSMGWTSASSYMALVTSVTGGETTARRDSPDAVLTWTLDVTNKMDNTPFDSGVQPIFRALWRSSDHVLAAWVYTEVLLFNSVGFYTTAPRVCQDPIQPHPRGMSPQTEPEESC